MKLDSGNMVTEFENYSNPIKDRVDTGRNNENRGNLDIPSHANTRDHPTSSYDDQDLMRDRRRQLDHYSR